MKRQQQGSLRETIITNRNEIHIRNKTRWPLTRYQSSVLFFFSFRNYNGKLFIFLFLFREKRNIQRTVLTRTWGVVPFNPASAKRRIEKEADIVAALLSPIIRSSRIFPAFPTNPNSCCTMDENYIYIYI